MIAQIEILALVQELKGVRIVDRRLHRARSHRLEHFVYDVQHLKRIEVLLLSKKLAGLQILQEEHAFFWPRLRRGQD
jgi:hypothetical protein